MLFSNINIFEFYIRTLLRDIERAATLRITLKQLKELLVLNSLRVQFRVVCTLRSDGVDVLVSQELWNMERAFPDVFARNQEVIAVSLKRKMVRIWSHKP